MKRNREEVCLYYMGFGLCAKGMHAEESGCCASCSKYQASGIKNGKANSRCMISTDYSSNKKY